MIVSMIYRPSLGFEDALKGPGETSIFYVSERTAK